MDQALIACATFLPLFSILFSAYRMIGHGIVQCIKACKDPNELIVETSNNPLG